MEELGITTIRQERFGVIVRNQHSFKLSQKKKTSFSNCALTYTLFHKLIFFFFARLICTLVFLSGQKVLLNFEKGYKD